MAQAFWNAPGPATWERYQVLCTPLYNTTPQDRDARQRTDFNTDVLFASARGGQRTMQMLPGLAKVCCPVLVLAGACDLVTPLAEAQEIAAAICPPCGRLVTFANAGHGAWRDEPEASMARLRAFVLPRVLTRRRRAPVKPQHHGGTA